jgi:GAF domain-containing protein
MQDQAPLRIANIVLTALDQRSLAGLSIMLKSIAEAVDAYGCILWQTVPGADFNKPSGHLFVLAEWFPDKKRDALHGLPIGESVTGQAVAKEQIINVKDISKDKVYPDPFLQETGITSFCSVPIRFRQEAREEGPKRTRGAINVYRNKGDAFTAAEVVQVKQLADLVPALYEATRDKVSLDVMRTLLNDIMHDTELKADDTPISKGQMKGVIQRICDLITNTFQCIETTIFLEDRLELPGVYELMGTTWPEDLGDRKHYKDSLRGLTEWVLGHAKPVTIFNLAHFNPDDDATQREYPGISWNDSLKIKESVMRFRALKDESELPPLSFMAAPIVRDGEIYGVIRCSVAKESPYYFADLALNLLELIAAQISHYWETWLSRSEMQNEIHTWQALVESISELNSFAQKELVKPTPNNHPIFKKTMQLTKKVIKGAEIMDIRLANEADQVLRFDLMDGEAWKKGSKEDIKARRDKTYPLNDPARESFGATVFRTGEVLVEQDVKGDKRHWETFPDVTRLICAPIKVEDNKYGVLDILSTGERKFSRHAQAIAELLGQQLGLYTFLAGTIGELGQTRAELSKSVDKQMKTFQNLAHQFKSPIIQAQRTVQLVIDDMPEGDKRKRNLYATRGLCVKAKLISFSTELFAALASESQIPIKGVDWLPYDELMKLLKEAAHDNWLLNTENIKFYVDEQAFEETDSKRTRTREKPKMKEVYVAKNLLEQAVTNILDNARKYSHSNTTVRIHGGKTTSDGFRISVANYGIHIGKDDILECKKNGWQSEDAQATSGEGSGIGLWIVDQIMTAHDGHLTVSATTTDHLTEVSLIFPATRVR